MKSNVCIHIRLTYEEKQKIKKRAEDLELELSQYCRRVLLNRNIPSI